jgi:hypothetical protein
LTWIVATSDDIDQAEIRVAFKAIQQADDTIDNERRDVRVLSSKWLSVHNGPVEFAVEVLEETTPIAVGQVIPDLLNTLDRSIFAVLVVPAVVMAVPTFNIAVYDISLSELSLDPFDARV